jgi:hypothetical protein
MTSRKSDKGEHAAKQHGKRQELQTEARQLQEAHGDDGGGWNLLPCRSIEDVHEIN